MRRPAIPAVLLLLALLPTAALAAEADVNALIREFLGDADPVARDPAALVAAHSAVLGSLLPKLTAENAAERVEPSQFYERIAHRAARPGADAERQAVCTAMAARLGPQVPLAARKFLLRLLANLGKEESVPALTSALKDKEPLIREAGRRALEHNPSPKAADALRTALAAAPDPAWRAALIHALARHPGPTCVRAVIPYATAKDPNVRIAALAALGRLGDTSAANTLAAAMGKGPARVRHAATDSYLLLADALCEHGRTLTALGMYRKLLHYKGPIRCAAIIGLGRAGGAKEVHTILKAMDDADLNVRGAALAALELLPTANVIGAVQARLKTADTSLKLLLLRALAQRADKASLPAFADAAGDRAEAVRLAAYAGMARLGDPRAAPTLIAALLKATGREARAAHDALVRLQGADADAALVQALASAPAAAKVAVIRALATRRATTAVPALMKAVADADARVSVAALLGVGEMGQAAVLPDLLKFLLATTDDATRTAAGKACAAICRRVADAGQAAAGVISVYDGASPGGKAALLGILGRIRGAKALAHARGAAADGNDTVQDAAVRALAAWDDPAVADALIAIAKDSANPTHRVLALRGFVKVMPRIRGRAADEFAPLLQAALDAARRPEDKKMVLSGLAGVPHVAALRVAQKCQTDPALRREAVLAITRIAIAIGSFHAKEAMDALEQVPLLSDDNALVQQARKAIEAIQRFDDYVVSWEYSGPYTKPGRQPQDDQPRGGPLDAVFPPESKGAKAMPWIPYPIDTGAQKPWLLEFDKTLGGHDCAVYVRTQVYSPKAQKVRMQLGSDDSVKVWLNGTMVHRNPKHRACKPDEDKKPVTLNEGWNLVMMKVAQGMGNWAGCMRFRTLDGKKLDGVYAQASGE